MSSTNSYLLLSEILEARRQISVELQVNSETKVVSIVYDPSKFTPELESKINAGESDLLGDQVLGLLGPLFVDWSIKMPPKTDDGPPEDFPPTVENLSRMPFPILTLFLKAIMEDITPGKRNTRR